MYNEGEEEFYCSLKGIITDFGTQLAENRALVVVIVDGMEQLHKNKLFVQKLEKKYGLYNRTDAEAFKKAFDADKAIRKKAVNTWKEQYKLDPTELDSIDAYLDSAVVYEGRLAIGVGDVVAAVGSYQDEPSVDVLFMVKAENRKKLHSHLWLFLGFCRYFQPEIVFVPLTQLIDIGTEATEGSLKSLQSHMEKYPQCGGCCGEIIVRDVPWYGLVLGAQWFEFKIGHILNKTFESVMGYVAVLPGAFSVYRWQALIRPNDQSIGDEESSVLTAYFKPFMEPDTLTWAQNNVYQLAEDRVMSEKIITFAPRAGDVEEPRYYTLDFVKSAKALTEGQPDLPHLMNQRRRWINGSWFALLQMLDFEVFFSILRTKRNCLSKFLITVQLLYLLVIVILTWLGVGFFYVGFSSVVSREFDDIIEDRAATRVVLAFYVFFLANSFLLSLSTKAENVAEFWSAACFFYSLISILFIYCAVNLFVSDHFLDNLTVRYYALATVVAMALAVLIYYEDYRKLTLFSLYYLLMMPTYVNVLAVFALCKTDDLTWGTRGSARNASSKDKYSSQKTKYLVFYVTCNFLVAAFIER